MDASQRSMPNIRHPPYLGVTLAKPASAVTGAHVTLPWTAARGAVSPRAMTWDAELDATSLLCPLPVLKARKRLLALPPGAVLRVIADDPAALVDVPHFCAEQGHVLVGEEDLGYPRRAYLIRRRG